MTALLMKPWRIDRRGERIYIDAPGEVCVDITSGTPEDRARVMALLEQARHALALLKDFHANYEFGPDADARMARILRDAGVVSGVDGRGGE